MVVKTVTTMGNTFDLQVINTPAICDYLCRELKSQIAKYYILILNPHAIMLYIKAFSWKKPLQKILYVQLSSIHT